MFIAKLIEGRVTFERGLVVAGDVDGGVGGVGHDGDDDDDDGGDGSRVMLSFGPRLP